jgi:glycosyltransferase involved in cell wall biosynthesis
VSAVLITKDAERHLDRVLEPLAVCAEIVVLDSGSSDRTHEIAEAHGALWHEHPFDGFGPQKRRAVGLANHDWIVAVDADEVLDGEAAGHMWSIRWAEQDYATCWKIRRRPFIGDREIRHGHWVPDHVVRVFNRTRNNFSNVPLHESVSPTGPVKLLPGSLLHFSYADLAELFRADYFRLKAKVFRARGRRAGGGEIALRAMAAFLKSYLLRRGFLDGGAGVAVALAGAAHASVGLALASEGGADDPRRLDDPSVRP